MAGWLGAASLFLVLLLLALRGFGRWGERWGATAEEFVMPLPGDAWLDRGPPVRVRMTRAIEIDAPPDHVWPWIEQMGRGAGWYSYDRLDNGGCASARHLVSWIPEPRLGDAATIGYLRHLVSGKELAYWLPGGDFFGAYLRGVMFYRVIPGAAGSRLLVRIQADARGPFARVALFWFRIVDSIMARRQLIGIKQRAECFGTREEDPDAPETGARDQYQLYQAILADGTSVGRQARSDAALWRRAAIEDGVGDENGRRQLSSPEGAQE